MSERRKMNKLSEPSESSKLNKLSEPSKQHKSLQVWMTILPSPLRTILEKEWRLTGERWEELRIREGRPLEVIDHLHAAFITPSGERTLHPAEGYKPDKKQCAMLLDVLTGHSLYTFEEELKRGYITIAGGHRVGLAGRTILEQGKVRFIRDISSFNIRIARQVLHCAKPLIPQLYDASANTIHHTLVLSAPQQGKTTLIRDMARLLSYGLPDCGLLGMKVGVVDERSELAACVKGVPHFDVGPRTDVLDGCPKAEGMMMLIRSMSPQVIVVDEIGTAADAVAIEEALHAGIRVIASAHAHSVEEARQRPALKALIDAGVFKRFVLLSKRQGRHCTTVLDDAGHACTGNALSFTQ